jgi:hypothetical protein
MPKRATATASVRKPTTPCARAILAAKLVSSSACATPGTTEPAARAGRSRRCAMAQIATVLSYPHRLKPEKKLVYRYGPRSTCPSPTGGRRIAGPGAEGDREHRQAGVDIGTARGARFRVAGRSAERAQRSSAHRIAAIVGFRAHIASSGRTAASCARQHGEGSAGQSGNRVCCMCDPLWLTDDLAPVVVTARPAEGPRIHRSPPAELARLLPVSLASQLEETIRRERIGGGVRACS